MGFTYQSFTILDYAPNLAKKTICFITHPFEKTLWLDLDCQVSGLIGILFSYFLTLGDAGLVMEPDREQAIAIQKGILKLEEKLYNAGVIVFSHGSKLIREWTTAIIEKINFIFQIKNY